MSEIVERLLAGGSGANSPVSYVIFFVFIGFLIGAALRGIRGRIKIPYTPVLLVLGLLVGLFLNSLGFLGTMGKFISGIEPTGILLIFIPILIFESSFNADWHVFKHSKYQIVLLAGPGLAISFALIAVTMKVILRYTDEEMSWSSALMFGSILAITDPVSIITLLKEVGAPHYFSTIIEGESLLNDGSGIAFFAIFSNLATGKEINVGLGIAAFLFYCIGGIAIGVVFGFIASLWQERINKDAVLSITIVFCACYLLFWIAESFKLSFNSEFKIGVSGTVGLCIFGLYMAANGRTVIPTRVEHPLHAVVSWAQYASETLIFLFCGILVGQILSQKNTTIEAADWGKLIAFFVMLNIIRMIGVGVLSPLLNRLGYKLNLKELFVLSYAGMRGAFSLVLALSVDVDTESFSQRTRELVLLYTAGSTLLTISVNGMTIGPIIRKIRMIKKFPAKSNIFKAFVKEMDELGNQTYQKLREENPGIVCDWDIVKGMTCITNQIKKKPTMTTLPSEAILPSKRYSSYVVNDQELKTEARFRLLQMFKQLIWEKYKDAGLSGQGANVLERAVNISLDDPSKPIRIFDFLHDYFMKPKTLEIFSKLSRVPIIGTYFKKSMATHMILIYEVNACISEITEELKFYADNMPVKTGLTKTVFKEFTDLKETADSYQNKLGDRFSGIIKYIMTKHCVTKILIAQKKLIEERYKTGEIEHHEHDELIALIDKKMRRLHLLIQVKWEPPSFLSLLTGFPLFNLLSQEELDQILETSKLVRFSKGQFIFEEGKQFDGIYLIRSGEVEILSQNNHYKKGSGHIISLFNLVMPDNISKMTCIASNSVETHKLDLNLLRKIMQQNHEFEEKVYKGAFNLLRFMKPELASTLIHLSETSAKALMSEARLVRFSKEQKIPLQNGGFVLKGQVQRKEKVYSEYNAIPKGINQVLALTEGLLFQFNISELTRRQSSVMFAVEKLID